MLTQKIAMGNRPSKSPFFSSAFHDGSAVTWVTARRHANWEALTAAVIVGSALASGNNPCLCSKTYPITEGTHPPPRRSAVLRNLFVLESGRRDGQNRAAILPESRISGALRNEWKETDLAETTARSTIDVAQAARRSYR